MLAQAQRLHRSFRLGPELFPSQLVQYANGQLKTKMLFGSDFPLIQPDCWIQDFREARLHARGARPLKLAAA
jgi:predicted TIM-barrel fold metal-dependent hydrolase